MVAKSIAKMYTNIHKPTDYTIRRSLRPLGRLASLLTRWDMMAKPTPASRVSSLVRPIQKKQ